MEETLCLNERGEKGNDKDKDVENVYIILRQAMISGS